MISELFVIHLLNIFLPCNIHVIQNTAQLTYTSPKVTNLGYFGVITDDVRQGPLLHLAQEALVGDIMVLISDGNSEIDAHVRSNLCYVICLRHLINSRVVTNRITFLR